MKIADIADMLKISKQAVYQRIKRAGLNVNTLKDPKTGEIRADMLDEVLSLFDKPQVNIVEHSTESLKLSEELNACKKRVEELNGCIQNLEQQLESVSAERDFLKNSLSQALTALDQAQQLQAMTLQRMLPAPRQGILERLRGIFSKQTASDTDSKA